MAVWLVRAGRYGGEDEHVALERNLAVVGWEDLGDLSNALNTDRRARGGARMTRRMRRLRALLTATAAAAITLLFTPSTLWALPISDARIIVEINGTDGDAGVQFFLDGKGWRSCSIFDPDSNLLVNVTADGSAGTNGLTELSIESAEPSFQQQTLAELVALFPVGDYPFDCETTGGQNMNGTASLTHKFPATPTVTVSQGANVAISWQAVPGPFQLGVGDPDVVIGGWEVIIERLSDGRKFSITFPADVTSVTVPSEFIEAGTKYKGEVLAIEESGNQTIAGFQFMTSN